MPTVTPQALTRTVQDFLSEAAGAVVLENGAVAFDLAQSKYSISGEYNTGGAEVGTGSALEAGDLPRTRPSFSYGSASGPGRV